MRRIRTAVRGQDLAEREEVREERVREADIVGAETPSVVHVAVERGERQWQDAPDQRLVHHRDVVRHRDQPARPCLVVSARPDEVEEPWQAMDFGPIEGV